MTVLSIQPSFPIFTDRNGKALENGYIYIGTANQDPQTNPINVYWDAGLTQPAAQPIRTINGYPSNSGTAARLYVNSDYSCRVKDKKGNMVYSAPSNTERYIGEYINVKNYGAVGDGVTDDLAAFNLAVSAAIADGKALFIPPTANYYKITSTLTIAGQSFNMFGCGTNSCIVVHNNSGASAIEVTGDHCSIRDIGISGIGGSGHGLHINSTTGIGQGRYSGIWCGWVDGDGIRVTKGQSNIFTEVSIDQNSGYRPITLTGGAVEGNTNNAFNILSAAGGNTNNQSFVNCRSNAGAANGYGLKIGDSGATTPESCTWTGGLLQGSANYTEVYIHGRNCSITGAHIEPPAGATANYCVTIEASSNVVISDCGVQGDARVIAASDRCGFENVIGCGFVVSSDSTRSFWHGGVYKNILTGPAGGLIRDESMEMSRKDILNASNSIFAASDLISSTTEQPTQATDFEYWYDSDGAGALSPYDFTAVSGVTRDSSTKRSGAYSAKVIPPSDLAATLVYSLPAYAAGRNVRVEAWVYNATTAGDGYIVFNSSSATVGQESFYTGKWERMVVTFSPAVTDTGMTLRFTGLSGKTIYWDSVKISIEDSPTQIESGFVTATLTPSTSGSITLSSHNRLQYTKIGRQVTVIGYLGVTSVSAPVGDLRLGGIPYAIGTMAGKRDMWCGGSFPVNSIGILPTQWTGVSGNSYITIYKLTGGNLASCAADITASADFFVGFTYLTN